MKLTKDVQVFITGVIFTILMFVMLYIAALFSSCTYAKTSIPPEYIISAYNNVIHRIWIDNPNYVEDVLQETDEFQELNTLLENKWEDTFLFHCVEDSTEYYFNLDNGR